MSRKFFKIIFSIICLMFFLYALQLVFANHGMQWAGNRYIPVSSRPTPEPKPIYAHRQDVQIKINSTHTLELYSSSNIVQAELPKFTTLEANILSLSPGLDDLGTYDIAIVSEDENARYEYTFIISVGLPDVDLAQLKLDVQNILGDQGPKYAVYVYDLKREVNFGINEEEIFYPGSTSKLPYAIIALRDVDSGKYTLPYVRPILERLIIHGSNSAMMELEAMHGGNLTYNERVRNELGVDNIFRSPHVVQASDLGKLYYGIYHEEYLSKSTNDFLLYLLLNTGPGYDNRIKQGLPTEGGVTFAHKTGWVTTTGGGEAYNDSGIVYGELTDYVIVVLDRNINKNNAIVMMKPISERIYDALNGIE